MNCQLMDPFDCSLYIFFVFNGIFDDDSAIVNMSSIRIIDILEAYVFAIMISICMYF